MYLVVKYVSPIEKYKLILTFEDDSIKLFDMNPYLEKGISRNKKIKIYLNQLK